MENFGYRYRRSNHHLPRRKFTTSTDKPKESHAKPSTTKVASSQPKPTVYVHKPARKYWLKTLLVLLILAPLIIFGVHKVSSKNQTAKQPESSPSASTTINSNGNYVQLGQNQPTTPANSIGQTKFGTSSTAVPPDFAVYYPVNLPAELQVDKSSIAYTKDSYLFSVQEHGQNQFFVSESPAGSNFSYQRLKVRMGSPMEIDTALGKGVFGSVGSTNFVTAVNTNKNTLIVLNCLALQCGSPSVRLIGSLQINNDPTHIH